MTDTLALILIIAWDATVKFVRTHPLVVRWAAVVLFPSVVIPVWTVRYAWRRWGHVVLARI